jgi:hypothetical protein
MATLATGVLGSFFTGGNTGEMRILVELQPYIGMAGLTGSTSNVVVVGLVLSSCQQR